MLDHMVVLYLVFSILNNKCFSYFRLLVLELTSLYNFLSLKSLPLNVTLVPYLWGPQVTRLDGSSLWKYFFLRSPRNIYKMGKI